MTKGKASVPKVVKMRRQKRDNAAENDIKNIYNFFIESNCFPFQSLSFQQSSYLMYDVHAKPAPKRLLNKSAKISTKHHCNARLSAKECFSVNFSRTQKMKKSFTRIGVFIWNSIPHSG